MKPDEGRKRVIIEAIQPQVDCGRYPPRRYLNDRVDVSAAIFSDGHDHVAARLLWKHASEHDWRPTPMTPLGNDLWSAAFTVDRLGPWVFTIQAWVDHLDTWCDDLRKRLAAQPDPASSDPAKRDLPPQDIPVAFNIGAELFDQAAASSAPQKPDLPPQDIPVAFNIGAELLDQAAARANGADAKQLKTFAAS